MKKNIVIGIVAHVDAGKTTLSEAMLYLSGKIRKAGRVDHRDSYLDNHSLERQRGITIFSKQAVMELEHSRVTLLDTPGHADLSAETERALRVPDCAVLVISGTDGVQAHTETLWRLLERYGLPCMVFVTKMDMPGADRAEIMAGLRSQLSEGCVDFSEDNAERMEQTAMCSEAALEKFLQEGALTGEDISALTASRRLFPCYFGSGLKLEGVEALLHGIDTYVEQVRAKSDFAARVFKIEHDGKGARMSIVKVTGGELRTRALLEYRDDNGRQLSEKISQIRIYSGAKYEAADCVYPGQVCALLGLSGSYPGQGLGAEEDAQPPMMEPVVSYSLVLPQGSDPTSVLQQLISLREEDPQLHIGWDEEAGRISVQLMGRMQEEIFLSLLKERFELDAELDSGRIMYRETIENTVEGVGHFEPLRHYAEVHLILQPLPRGSGIVIDSVCSEDILDRNWQRLILSHLQERQLRGVLTNAPLTDIKISLVSGRAHPKHTEGGDFRQAAFRALRQGLMQAKSLLLEPYYSFNIQVPPEQIGRAISDVRAMNGSFSSPEEAGALSRIEGRAPVSEMRGYGAELTAYTHGRGRFACMPDGYMPCHDAQSVIEAAAYDPESDILDPCDSVFCAHGSGFTVKWDKVPEYMHLESCLEKRRRDAAPQTVHRSISIDERELEAIMEREFGPIRRREYSAPLRNEAPSQQFAGEKRQQYIIVDGYNLIFAWEELKTLAAEQLDLARERLADILSNYCGFTGAELVLVFDGFRTAGNPGSKGERHNIRLAYTGEGETADAYIEGLANQIGRNYAVRVVTNDRLIRLSALRSGVLRSSTEEFRAEVEDVLSRIEELLKKSNDRAHMTRLKNGRQ